MSKVITLDEFEKHSGRLCRKYRSLLKDIDTLIDSLEKNPLQGVDLGAGLHKIRLGTASKGRGKSGGFRVITYYIDPTTENDTVYLVTIYDKSERSNITKKELLKILENEL